jgi:hypothetical protein
MIDLNSKNLHDLKSVYTDFKIILNLVQSGYRFDDEDAPTILRQLEKTLVSFKSELDEIEKQISR